MDRRDSWADRQISITLEEDIPEKEPESQKPIYNDVEKKSVKEKGLGLWKSIRVYFREYCANSSLHGVKYFGEKGRTVTERVWWLIIFIASILMCSNLIMKTWDKWDTSPVIVSFAQSPTPVWQVPFPAVTICPQTKLKPTVYNFTNEYNRYRRAYMNRYVSEEFTPDEFKPFEDASLICDKLYFPVAGPNTTDSIIHFIHEVAPQLKPTMLSCQWTNQVYIGTCSMLFYPMLTEEGLCYTFNMLDNSELLNPEVQDNHYLNHGLKADWSLVEGYKKGSDKHVYPRRGMTGYYAGLIIEMKAYDEDLDYMCKGPFQGFKILLHNPAETPGISQGYIHAPLDQEVNVAVKPDMMTTSDGLKDYHPFRRHCYFQGQKVLRFFKVYTQHNCEVECLANYLLEKCGCVGFYMPRFKNTPICGSGKRDCMWKEKFNLLLREIETEVAKDNVEAEKKKNMKKCNCLPSCTSLAYSAETSQADFNWKKNFEAFEANLSKFSGEHMTRVKIFFKDTEFITTRRNELYYGITDFLSSCGGLLGLFMGFSFLSLMEIVYFLTLRMWCNIKMHGRKIWNASRINSMQNNI